MTIGKDLGSQELMFILGVWDKRQVPSNGETEAQHEEETFQELFGLLAHLPVSLTSLHCSSSPLKPHLSQRPPRVTRRERWPPGYPSATSEVDCSGILCQEPHTKKG